MNAVGLDFYSQRTCIEQSTDSYIIKKIYLRIYPAQNQHLNEYETEYMDVRAYIYVTAYILVGSLPMCLRSERKITRFNYFFLLSLK